VSWERLAVYTLTCDRNPCLGKYREPSTEDILPPPGSGVRGARKEAAGNGWTRDGDLDVCPACSKAGRGR
jgi:hypothetical protein